MNSYQKTTPIRAIVWKPGVELFNANAIEFPRIDFPSGSFPPHALVVVSGKYEVLFEGFAVVYGDHGQGNPTGILESITEYTPVL